VSFYIPQAIHSRPAGAAPVGLWHVIEYCKPHRRMVWTGDFTATAISAAVGAWTSTATEAVTAALVLTALQAEDDRAIVG